MEQPSQSSSSHVDEDASLLLGEPVVGASGDGPSRGRRRRGALRAAIVGLTAAVGCYASLRAAAPHGTSALSALGRLAGLDSDDATPDGMGNVGDASGGAGGAAAADDDAGDDATVDDDTLKSALLDFEVHNDYTELTRKPIGHEYAWISRYKFAEPHRPCKFMLTGSLASDDSKKLNIQWLVDGTTMSGREVGYTFNATGKYHVMIQASFSKHSVSAAKISSSAEVWVKYVRREIRSLLDADRNAYFDALEAIYVTPCDDGKRKYGEDFECIETFTAMHNDLAGDPYCDHAHDGFGFLTMHAALSLWFEKVLQTVKPDVALPYWDYTIDMHAVGMAGGDTRRWRDSIVWSDDWFGTSRPERIDHVIDKGRFAWTPVTVDNRNLSMFTNGYGMMRAPWNNNRAHYVTRSNESYGFELTDLPGCASHHKVLQYTNFSDFGYNIMYNPHGTTHLAIGGTWNGNWKKVLKENNYDLQMAPSWTLLGFAKQKNLFRAGDIHCPSYCSLDTPEVDCRCECPGIHGMIHSGKYHTLLDIFMLSFDPYLYNRFGEDVSEVIYKLLCNFYDDTFAVMGDSLESASPADVSFWPTHPTVDRLFQWRRLNGMESMHWPDGKAWSVEGTKISYCQGHDTGDILPFTELFEGHDGPYSNKELVDLLDPTGADSPYIYDNFEWPHCLDEGYSIDLLEQIGIPDGNIRFAYPPSQNLDLRPKHTVEDILAAPRAERFGDQGMLWGADGQRRGHKRSLR